MERLYRPKSNRIIAGVCAGFAEYFRIDPTIIRIIWILISLSGTGVLAYVIAAVIMPDETKVTGGGASWNEGRETEKDDFVSSIESERENWGQPPKYNSERSRFVIGAVLIGLGVLFLGRMVMPALFELKYLVPVLLIGVGGYIVMKGRR